MSAIDAEPAAGPPVEPRVVEDTTSTLPLLAKAARTAVPGASRLLGRGSSARSGGSLPEIAVARRGVAVDRDHVAAYAEVCGLPLTDALPLTYPHVLAFGLHLSVLTDDAFPFPALGTVHLANVITAHRPLRASDRLDLTVWPAALRPHPKGRAFDLHTQVSAGGEQVWEATSTFLRPGRGDPKATSGSPGPEAVASNSVRWRLPGDLGRRYAAVSGDYNPIHLAAVTARPFGFRRPIAHGMWSMARCLGALEGRLPEAVTVEVTFKKPVLLPRVVAFGAEPTDDGYAFAVTDQRTGAPHVLGRSRPPAED